MYSSTHKRVPDLIENSGWIDRTVPSQHNSVWNIPSPIQTISAWLNYSFLVSHWLGFIYRSLKIMIRNLSYLFTKGLKSTNYVCPFPLTSYFIRYESLNWKITNIVDWYQHSAQQDVFINNWFITQKQSHQFEIIMISETAYSSDPVRSFFKTIKHSQYGMGYEVQE